MHALALGFGLQALGLREATKAASQSLKPRA
jgi:hypothetical protein